MVAGMRLDCDGIARHVSTLLVGLRLRAAQSIARPLLWAVLILLAGLGAASSAPADTRKHGDGEIDTEHMFGFTEGSDTGEAGEKELETDSTGRFGKPDGAYNNVAT